MVNITAAAKAVATGAEGNRRVERWATFYKWPLGESARNGPGVFFYFFYVLDRFFGVSLETMKGALCA